MHAYQMNNFFKINFTSRARLLPGPHLHFVEHLGSTPQRRVVDTGGAQNQLCLCTVRKGISGYWWGQR